MNTSDLSDELIAKARGCKSVEELEASRSGVRGNETGVK